MRYVTHQFSHLRDARSRQALANAGGDRCHPNRGSCSGDFDPRGRCRAGRVSRGPADYRARRNRPIRRATRASGTSRANGTSILKQRPSPATSGTEIHSRVVRGWLAAAGCRHRSHPDGYRASERVTAKGKTEPRRSSIPGSFASSPTALTGSIRQVVEAANDELREAIRRPRSSARRASRSPWHSMAAARGCGGSLRRGIRPTGS